MDRPALKALILPFERQDRPMPGETAPWGFFNAHPLPKVTIEGVHWRDGLICQQDFRPHFLDCENAGFSVSPILEQTDLAGCLVLTDRAKAVNERNVLHAINAVRENAPILICGEKTTGIAPLKKWAAKLASIDDSFSKFHAQCFTITASQETKESASAMLPDADAGLFAKGKADKGSAVLAETFDESLSGDMADFCSGSGYLAEQLIERSKPNSLTLMEAAYHAVEASRKKLQTKTIPTSFHWLDLTREPTPARFDTIVMNPPFHTGRAAEPELGQSLIRAAQKALRPGGRLRLVANRNLPYERTLNTAFGSFKEILVKDGFKVLEARAKP